MDTLNKLERLNERLDDLNREDQLALLIHEIEQIIIYNIPLERHWYAQRKRFIYEYATEIDWLNMSKRFAGKNQYISSTSHDIAQSLDQLIQEWDSHPSLPMYKRVLNDIQNVWIDYQQNYVGDEDDPVIVNLIEELIYVGL